MSLIVQNLTKVYGRQKAVDCVSFEVRRGEIVGFLGPNGAGKSTTMKIMTTLLPPTEGKAEVAGFDTMDNPTDVKKAIGYLPENNPLYTEMYVHEYLRFAGKLYGLSGKELRAKVNEMVEIFGLKDEQNKKIEMLSKGYMQRVGLAQSLIHDPAVLILDEPTSGLDPNQLVEIRNLIKQISKNKTVLFSSHIMQEVSALCDRAVVINKGKIVADDLLSSLMSKQTTGHSVIVEFETDTTRELLGGIKGVVDVQALGSGKFRIVADDNIDLRAEIFRYAADKNLTLIGLQKEDGTLEGLFRQLTTDEAG